MMDVSSDRKELKIEDLTYENFPLWGEDFCEIIRLELKDMCASYWIDTRSRCTNYIYDDEMRRLECTIKVDGTDFRLDYSFTTYNLSVVFEKDRVFISHKLSFCSELVSPESSSFMVNTTMNVGLLIKAEVDGLFNYARCAFRAYYCVGD